MTFQPGATVYTQGFGSRAEKVEVPHLDTRAPGTSDMRVIGKRWVDQVGNAEYILTSITSFNGSMTANWTLTGSTTNISVTGSITAGTSLTATNGNLTLGSAGNKVLIHATTAASDSIGTTTNMAGTPGTITVSTTAVTTNSKIFITRNTVGGALGNISCPSASIVNGTSFVINSDANETSTFNYWIVN